MQTFGLTKRGAQFTRAAKAIQELSETAKQQQILIDELKQSLLLKRTKTIY